MRISLNWIRRLLPEGRLPATARELQARLSLTVCEIEHDILATGPRLDGVVVGKVLTCAQHPNADRLRCTTVNIGGGKVIPVVCGAANVAAGQTVAVATIGAVLSMPGKDGKPVEVTIKASKLRGEPSEGMICAEDELGLGTGHDGILVLDDQLAAGTPLAQVQGGGDEVLQVENSCISHRSDLWGQLGWAREIAAAYGVPGPAAPAIAWTDEGGGCAVSLDDPDAQAYAGAVVEGVTDGESPAWLRDLLTAAGVRPISLLVDVTNLVMLELGQPMHAFDAREVRGGRLRVRAAAEGERLELLDGKVLELHPADLVIADAERPLALAGIMGGKSSGIAAGTTTVVLEGASFRAERIRRSRIRHGVASDASARFEKGLQPESAAAATLRAIALLRELCPGCRVTCRFSAGALRLADARVDFAPADVDRIAGIQAPAGAHAAALARLGFAAEGAAVAVPWWRRKDVALPIDLVEEAARIFGYERIVPAVPRLPAAAPAPDPQRQAEHGVRAALSALGWDEVATYAFTSPSWVEALGWDARTIALQHPLSQEQSVLRRDLMPGLLEAIARNRAHAARVAIYEVGAVYGAGCGAGDHPDEDVVLCGAVAGAADEAPFYAARAAALGALARLGFAAAVRAPKEVPATLVAGRCAELTVGREIVGVVGEVAPALRAKAGCPERCGWFRIDLARMLRALPAPRPVAHRMPSRFQSVTNDFTWEVDESGAWEQLAAPTRKAAGELAQGVELVSVYRGAPYPAGRKAVCLRLTLQSWERTLGEADIRQVRERVAAAVASAAGAVLRG